MKSSGLPRTRGTYTYVHKFCSNRVPRTLAVLRLFSPSRAVCSRLVSEGASNPLFPTSTQKVTGVEPAVCADWLSGDFRRFVVTLSTCAFHACRGGRLRARSESQKAKLPLLVFVFLPPENQLFEGGPHTPRRRPRAADGGADFDKKSFGLSLMQRSPRETRRSPPRLCPRRRGWNPPAGAFTAPSPHSPAP